MEIKNIRQYITTVADMPASFEEILDGTIPYIIEGENILIDANDVEEYRVQEEIFNDRAMNPAALALANFFFHNQNVKQLVLEPA